MSISGSSVTTCSTSGTSERQHEPCARHCDWHGHCFHVECATYGIESSAQSHLVWSQRSKTEPLNRGRWKDPSKTGRHAGDPSPWLWRAGPQASHGRRPAGWTNWRGQWGLLLALSWLLEEAVEQRVPTPEAASATEGCWSMERYRRLFHSSDFPIPLNWTLYQLPTCRRSSLRHQRTELHYADSEYSVSCISSQQQAVSLSVRSHRAEGLVRCHFLYWFT